MIKWLAFIILVLLCLLSGDFLNRKSDDLTTCLLTDDTGFCRLWVGEYWNITVGEENYVMARDGFWVITDD